MNHKTFSVDVCLFFLCLLPAIYLYGNTSGVVLDDTYIYFRVVKNMLAGNGPYINTGDSFLGVTSILWTILLAGSQKMMPYINLPVIAKSLFILMLSLASFFAFLTFRNRFRILAACMPFIFFINPMAFSFSGNEIGIVYFLIFAGIWSCIIKRNYQLTGVLTGVAYLCRGELIFMVTPVLCCIAYTRRSATLQSAAFDIVKFIIALLTIIVMWQIISFWVFGAVAPNTLHSKMIQGQSIAAGAGSFWRLYSQDIWNEILLAVWGCPVLLIFTLAGALATPSVAFFLGLFTVQHALGYSLLRIPSYPWYYYDIYIFTGIFTFTGIARFINDQHLQKIIPSRLCCKRFLLLSVRCVFGVLAFSYLSYCAFQNRIFDDFKSPTKILQNNAIDERFESYQRLSLWLKHIVHAQDIVLTPEIGIISYFLDTIEIRDINGLASPDVTVENMNSYEYFVNRYEPLYLIQPVRYGGTPERMKFTDNTKQHIYEKIFTAKPDARVFVGCVYQRVP